MRGSVFAGLSFGVALVLGTSASAGNPGRETIKYNTADQAAARATMIQRTDLRPATGWHGGAVKPDQAPPPTCPNFHPKLSDFVRTGAAASEWKRGGVDPNFMTQVAADVDVLKTAQMVRREWQVQVQDPAATSCLRSFLAKTYAREGAKLISFERVTFPHIATYSAAYRVVGKLASERFIAEIVLAGRGRTETEVQIFGSYGDRRLIASESLRLARILVGRVQA